MSEAARILLAAIALCVIAFVTWTIWRDWSMGRAIDFTVAALASITAVDVALAVVRWALGGSFRATSDE